MNTQSIDCHKVQYGEMKSPGDFCFDENFSTIYIWLPGMAGPDALKIQQGAFGGERVWNWNGDGILPTLVPSIHCPGFWHGFLRGGKLISC